MNVSFRQLRVFLAVAEQGSISAAARLCHVTQPTVSMQLRELAEAVGLPLYEVVGKRLVLTAAGQELAQTARAIAGEWASFEQRMDGMKGLERGRLRVAVVSTAQYFVPRILGDFCHRHPQIDVSLEVLNRDGVVQRLRENRDDLYIMSQPPRDVELDQQVFLPNPLVLIAAADHPLAGRQNLPLEALQGERFILREKGSGTRLACDAFFQAHGLQPDVRLELGSNEAIVQAVAGGMGLAVVSQHALAPQAASAELAWLDVQGFPIRSQWSIVTLRGKRLSPIAQVFLTQLEQQAQSFGQRPPPRVI